MQHVVAQLFKNNFFQRKNCMQVPKMWMASPFAIMGAWGFIKNKSEDTVQITKREVLIAKADAFFDQGDYKSIYDLLLNYKVKFSQVCCNCEYYIFLNIFYFFNMQDTKDVEILWRLSRALYKMSEMASDIEARKLIYEGYDLISVALDIQEDHYAVHKWLSILLNRKSTFEGTKAQIREVYNVKKHLLVRYI